MGDFMTIGTITTGSLFTSPYGFIKSWNGANGRKEIVSGTERDKWNNYSMYRFESRCVESQAFPGYGLYASISDPPWSSIWTSQHEVALQSKLTSAVRQHDFNLAVNVAQGVQTVDMLVGNLKKLGKSFLALKHGNVADALRQLGTGQRPRPLKAKDIPGRWLELQYGWLPLISDTYEAVKAYSVLTRKRGSLPYESKSLSRVLLMALTLQVIGQPTARISILRRSSTRCLMTSQLFAP